jgi:hypothetical protein
MKPKISWPSPAMIVALVALFLALGGVGVAATGDNFILGKSNSADATSYISAPVAAGNTLTLTNLDNTPGSSALRLNVLAGQAPLRVSSGAAKAPNLDADRLDGLDSTAFQNRITGTCGAGSGFGSVAVDGTVACTRSSVRPGYTAGMSLSMIAHHCQITQLSVPSAAVGDSGIVAPNAGTWPAGLTFQVLRANQAGKLPIDVCDPTDANVSSGNQTISIWVVKLTP